MPGRRLACLGFGIDTINPRLPVRVAGVPGGMEFGKPINPRFQEGERVQINLPKHLTHDWVGLVENSFFRPELRSNVYGIRFPEKAGLYTRYYESNLQKAP